MRRIILLLSFFIITLNSFAQSSMLGLTKKEVIKAQSYRDEMPEFNTMEEMISDEGMPYLFYFNGLVKKAEGFYFEKDACVKYTLVAGENFNKVVLRNFEEDGFFYEKGFWINPEKQIIAQYTKTEDSIRVSYWTIGYYLATYKKE
jgi:hypothetical protein